MGLTVLPVEVRDRDGELWWRDGDTESYYLLGDYSLPRSIAEIDDLFGPLVRILD